MRLPAVEDTCRLLLVGFGLSLPILASLGGCGSSPASISATTTVAATTTTTTSVPAMTSTTTSPTTTIAPNVSSFYRTYSVGFNKVIDTGCNITFANAGTITLSGDDAGDNVTIEVFERALRTYRGSIKPSGQFSGTGTGFTPGVLQHDYSGSIQGLVQDRRIVGSENLNFGAGCPDQRVRLEFDGGS